MKKVTTMIAAALTGCAGPGLLGNTPEDRGWAPSNVDADVRQILARTLKDPGSLQQLEVGSPMPGFCRMGFYGSFHAWVVPVAYNAKNSYGGYVGQKEYYFWFQGERFLGQTSHPDVCPEGAS